LTSSLDAAAQISAFGKLKLANCASAGDAHAAVLVRCDNGGDLFVVVICKRVGKARSSTRDCAKFLSVLNILLFRIVIPSPIPRCSTTFACIRPVFSGGLPQRSRKQQCEPLFFTMGLCAAA
jgi:hypothetical protein